MLTYTRIVYIIAFEGDKVVEMLKNTLEEITMEQVEEILVILLEIDLNRKRLKTASGIKQPAIWMNVADEVFLTRLMNHKIALSKGNLLRIIHRRIQKLSGDSINTDCIIDKVLEVRPAPKQIKLDFEYEE